MHRIDGPTAAPGGLWTEGDPVGGVPATIVSDDWMNDTQENLIRILTDAGIAPIKGDYTQLSAAIQKINTGRLLRTTIYINVAGVLQSSVDGGAFAVASATFTKHPLAITAEGEAQGGGGSGGNAASTAAGNISAGSGGAGGGYARKRAAIALFNGATITVGAGGGVGALAAGGTSSISGLITAPGGPSGATGANGSATNIPFGITRGGLGTGGDINVRGGMGFFSLYSASSLSGKGGSSLFGEGGDATSGVATTGNAGVSADSYGTGGSGAANGASVPTTINGGAGKGGLVIIREYA